MKETVTTPSASPLLSRNSQQLLASDFPWNDQPVDHSVNIAIVKSLEADGLDTEIIEEYLRLQARTAQLSSQIKRLLLAT